MSPYDITSQKTQETQTLNMKHIPIIFIEGGIGCGKSTLVHKIQEYCNANNVNILTIQEPVDIWMEIIDEKTGKNMIEAFYEDQKRYSFEFQMMAYISRLQRIQESIVSAEQCGIDFIICERSLQTDRNVFCKMLYDEGMIDDFGYKIYNKWFDYFNNFQEQSRYVYLKTDFDVCYERILKRKRNGESGIKKDYLQKNNQYHDEWLLQSENQDNVLVLNGNQNCENDDHVHDSFIDEILHFIKK